MITTRLNIIILGMNSLLKSKIAKRISDKYTTEFIDLDNEDRLHDLSTQNIDFNYVLTGFPNILSDALKLDNVDLVIMINSVDEIKDQTSKSYGEKMLNLNQVVDYYESKFLLERIDECHQENDIFSKICERIFKRFNI